MSSKFDIQNKHPVDDDNIHTQQILDAGSW